MIVCVVLLAESTTLLVCNCTVILLLLLYVVVDSGSGGALDLASCKVSVLGSSHTRSTTYYILQELNRSAYQPSLRPSLLYSSSSSSLNSFEEWREGRAEGGVRGTSGDDE